MEKLTSKQSSRVGLYIKPQTRNRLNLLKAELSYTRNRIVPVDEAIVILLDHYRETASKSLPAPVTHT